MVRSVLTTASTSLVRDFNSKYEEAVKTLNTLQTNAQALEKARSERDKKAHLNIPNMIKFAERADIQMDDIRRVPMIHVSGTKGKGSTCAFCESILRQYGLKTGFFSSPHLIEVRERIRINGAPLGRDLFSSYFWQVFSKLEQSKMANDGKMPNYFGFLTVMALHVFLQEKVDVAIMEVGIGGQYDCTNMIPSPVVCGVTSLGLDHTSILGNAIDKIAWHKAGIFKAGTQAVTAPQADEAMEVLRSRASEVGAPLTVCPDIRQYPTQGKQLQLGIKGNMQAVNASLALQLCRIFLNKRSEADETQPKDEKGENSNGVSCDASQAPAFPLTQQMLEGVKACQWLGRNQTILTPGVTYYVDGAHTYESIKQCVDWFRAESDTEEEKLREPVFRVMIFNTTGDRDTTSLLRPLLDCQFDAVLFCPNVAYLSSVSADQTNKTVTMESQTNRCLSNKSVWDQLYKESICGPDEGHLETKRVAANQTGSVNLGESSRNVHTEDGVRISNGKDSLLTAEDNHCDHSHISKPKKPKLCLNGETNQGPSVQSASSISNGRSGKHNNNGCITHTFRSISQCLAWATREKACKVDMKGDIPEYPTHFVSAGHIQVLVTGSIHLVGGALRVLQDDLDA